MDLRENYNPGWKFNHYELKGVPLRLELGPTDLKEEQVLVARRDDGTKTPIKWKDLAHKIPRLLQQIQKSMFDKALAKQQASIQTCSTWAQFTKALESRQMALSTWCGQRACEEKIKIRSGEEAAATAAATAATAATHGLLPAEEGEGEKLTGAAKSLCMPFDQPPITDANKCIGCNAKAFCWVLFGRSY